MLNGVAQRPLEGVSFAHTFDDARGADAQGRAVLRDDRLARAVGRRLEGGGRAAAGRAADRGDPRARRSGSSTTSREDFSECEDLADAASREARRAGRALVGRGRQVQRAAARLAHAAAHGRAQARHRAGRQPLRLLPGRRAAVRVHGGQRQEPLAHDHRRGRDSRQAAPRACCSRTAAGSPATRSTSRTGASSTCTTTSASPSTGSASTRGGAGRARSTLRFRFTRTGEHRGRGALYVGERLIGEGEIPHTVPARDRDLGRGPVLRLRQRPAGHRRLPRAVPLHRAHRRRSSSRSTTASARPTRKRSCAPR